MVLSDGGREPDIRDIPQPDDFVQFTPGFGPRFVVTVDTEEEFDWTKPFNRFGHGLRHVPWIGRFQAFCENIGIAPIYLIDYPVACDARVIDALGPAVASGRAEVGVQLHPWVSPPHDEDINVHNSYAGNLPPALERAKFDGLRHTIETAFGQVPLIYRAGRYGVGARTARMLADGGVTFDTSVRARFDYSAQGGPNFRTHPPQPWWIIRPSADDTGGAKQAGLMELPLTTVYCGLLRGQGGWLYHGLWRIPRACGVLARLGLLERVPLTPEGVDARAALRAIDAALADRLPLLVFSFHSPSLLPGHTPYVRDDHALDRMYDWWRTVFAHLRARGVAQANLAEIAAAAQA
ncbi:polysaccharide deacetylase family protein [Novosphingobium sp.]|uniref:polysaccharide deacetylase family protein n=1 Tax=Novosphingobium sp. TaxID=1874826 RepID=UPI003341E849